MGNNTSLCSYSSSHGGADSDFHYRIAEGGCGGFMLIVAGFFGQHDQFLFELSSETVECSDEDDRTL